jgi:hypothetical protein
MLRYTPFAKSLSPACSGSADRRPALITAPAPVANSHFFDNVDSVSPPRPASLSELNHSNLGYFDPFLARGDYLKRRDHKC